MRTPRRNVERTVRASPVVPPELVEKLRAAAGCAIEKGITQRELLRLLIEAWRSVRDNG